MDVEGDISGRVRWSTHLFLPIPTSVTGGGAVVSKLPKTSTDRPNSGHSKLQVQPARAVHIPAPATATASAPPPLQRTLPQTE